MAKVSGRTEYSIAGVSKLTGVSCHTLRVWERRYGFPIPRRTPSGHRRYAPDQVQALHQIARLAQSTRSVGDVIADYLAGRLGAAEGPGIGDGAKKGNGDGDGDEERRDPSVSGLVDALIAGNLTRAGAEYQRLAEPLSRTDLMLRVFEPALIEIGERWFRGECAIFQERSASGFLRRKLDELLDQAQRANLHPRHTALIGTVQGDRHEGGILIVGLLLELNGWRALPLGVDLPVREYQNAVESWHPDALVLSFVMSRNINKRFQELTKIRGVPIYVGGRSILNYQGLARRHGLIPLPGSASTSVSDLLSHFSEWKALPGD